MNAGHRVRTGPLTQRRLLHAFAAAVLSVMIVFGPVWLLPASQASQGSEHDEHDATTHHERRATSTCSAGRRRARPGCRGGHLRHAQERRQSRDNALDTAAAAKAAITTAPGQGRHYQHQIRKPPTRPRRLRLPQPRTQRRRLTKRARRSQPRPPRPYQRRRRRPPRHTGTARPKAHCHLQHHVVLARTSQQPTSSSASTTSSTTATSTSHAVTHRPQRDTGSATAMPTAATSAPGTTAGASASPSAGHFGHARHDRGHIRHAQRHDDQ